MKSSVLGLGLTGLVGLLFGAGDQYLGSLAMTTSLGWWTIAVSGLSAPWLLTPFVAGMFHARPRLAAAGGAVLTLTALVGYFLLTISPLEGAELTAQTVAGVVHSNLLWIATGVVTGPFYGWLGHRWRFGRSVAAGLLMSLALCLEPLAVVVVSPDRDHSLPVWLAEVTVGVVFTALVVKARLRPSATAT